MDKLVVRGMNNLKGKINVSPAKNAYLPIMAAALLTDQKTILRKVPKLRDIATMRQLLIHLGVNIDENDSDLTIDASHITSYAATYELVKTMRASICVLGPLLARFGEAKVSLPGGCAIGTRPIDIHLEGMKKLGATISIEAGYVKGSCKKLIGNKILLKFPSVGATENLMMAAALAKGETVIENAAKEPEIDDLAHFLRKMGLEIEGEGTSKIKIQGREQLMGCDFQAIGDRIEAGTYIMAGLITQGEIEVTGFTPSHLQSVIEVLQAMGARLETRESSVQVKPSQLKMTEVDTAPFPGFPTDLQAQFMAMCTQAEGTSVISEKIFENRFMHVPELQRLGADIVLKGNTAFVKGKNKLTGAPLMCTDLRASAALVLAALWSEGTSEISRIYHLERGYENLEGKLKNIGAEIERVKE